ncbi:MAG: energy transducer TonB [Thermodesulfovibrio sp.]|nr:energy transducer TonB [Thermodesulfovibrio sp. 1176]MDI6715100.1 energy transducer TonB [Thermodesulfovibrio sp.]
MKRAIVYSLIFHILLFTLLTFVQKNVKTKESLPEPISILILPQKPDTMEQLKPKSVPKSLERIHPLKLDRQPKTLSSIPKGQYGTEEIKKESAKENINQTFKENVQSKNLKKEPDIFDKDIIAKLSKHQKGKDEEIESSKGLSFSAKEFNDWGYLQRLKEKIERVWQYPPQAAERGIYGDLYIKFTIDKRGKLISVELLRTSGYRMLDDAAIKALNDAQPFWPLPEEWQKDSLTITGHFIYTLRGFYLR